MTIAPVPVPLTPEGTLPEAEWRGIIQLTTSHGTRVILDLDGGRVMRLPAPGRNPITHDGTWQQTYGVERPLGLGRSAEIYVYPRPSFPYTTTPVRAIARLVDGPAPPPRIVSVPGALSPRGG